MSAGEAHLNQPAPCFSGKALMPDGSFEDINLKNYQGKWVVLFFYPLDFTFVCPTEIIQFSDRLEEFKALNCEVIAASVDSHFSHLAWVNTERNKGGLGAMKIPILSDITKSISKQYGVLHPTDGVAYRGVFIIDPNQSLRHITINDMPIGRNVDEVLRLIQAHQFVEKHGEVCPANWKPGSKAMQPNSDGLRNYFGNH